MKSEIKQRIMQIKAGYILKGYKIVDKIGVIPKDWSVNSISKILKPILRRVKKPSEGYWRLGLRSHAKGTFHEFIENPETVNMEELYEVKENDLVVNITFAWEHAIAIAGIGDDGLLVSHRFPTYVFNNGFTPYFYKYVIIQKWFKSMLDGISPGGAGRNRVMSKSAFLKLNCISPSLKEQQKIAEILTTCDKLIELKEKLIEEKKKQKRWLMQNLLDPESGVRLPGFDGEWVMVKLGDECTTFSGGTPDRSKYNFFNGNIPWIKSGELNAKYVLLTEESITENGLTNSSAKIVKENTLLLALYGATAGVISVCKIRAAINQAILAIIPNRNIKNLFLRHYLENEMAIIISKYLQGGQPNLNAEIIKNLILKLPELSEQTAISEVLSTADNEIEILQNEIDEIKKQKKALMQLLLTGIVRVNL